MPALCRSFETEDNIFVKLERIFHTNKYAPFSDHKYPKEIDSDSCEIPRKKRKREALLEKLPCLRSLKYVELLLTDRIKPVKPILPKQPKTKTTKAAMKLVEERSSNYRYVDPENQRKRARKTRNEGDSVIRTSDDLQANGQVRLRSLDVSIPLAIYQVTSHGSGLKLRMQRKRTTSDGSSVNSEQYDDSCDSDAPSNDSSSDNSSCRETSETKPEKDLFSSRSRRILRRRCPCCR